MAKIFVSFDHGDGPVAETMKALLEYELDLRNEVFMVTDPTQLRAGDDWLKVVKEGLDGAQIVLLMLSKRSITKPWVNFEAGAGWLADKRVIPACFGNQKKANLPAPYSHWQGANLPEDQHFLLKTIADDLGSKAPNVLAKILGPQKPQSPLEKVLALRRDLSYALENWKDD